MPPVRPRLMVATALLAAFSLLTMPVKAAAEPTAPPNETGQPTLEKLQENLAALSAGYIEADGKVAASKAKQAVLQQEIVAAEADIAKVQAGVAIYAAEAYRTGRVGPLGLILRAHSREEFLGRATAMERLTQYDQARLEILVAAKERIVTANAAINAQLAIQVAAAQEMAQRKSTAEKAVAAAGGTPARAPVDPNTLPVVNPAPRNSDGSLARQSCSVDDPTTAGCISPRTLHALRETQRLGFGWYVSCFRPGNRYEHPKGRACDFSASEKGFVNKSATGDHKVYGDRLAVFLVKNAKALAVMYVVWYCQIWTVVAGWHRYSSAGRNCGDDPAGDHTNHVHLSVY